MSFRQLHVRAKPISSLQRVLCTGNPGSSKLIVNREQTELLRSSEFTWEEVAQILSISRTTLWRRVQELGIPMCKYSDISDHDLDHLDPFLAQCGHRQF